MTEKSTLPSAQRTRSLHKEISGGVFVIADDFTGAAEIAGISLRYGLTLPVVIYNMDDATLSIKSAAGADGAIICTDSRSMKKADAINATAAAIKEILKYKPALIYKKIDSVLRGYVPDEIKLQMALTGKDKAIILPANPSLGRTIVDATYFIDGKKITETGFVHDPEFPVSSAAVKQMIKDEQVSVLKLNNALPEKGIVVGEAQSDEDVTAWANAIDQSWIKAGAGDFYMALLSKYFRLMPQTSLKLQSPHLYVCGTAFKERQEYVNDINSTYGSVSYLPEKLTGQWFQQTCDAVQKKQQRIIAISNADDDAVSLRIKMADAVKNIIEKEKIPELFIEGGSTAAAVLKKLDIHTLSPVNELQRGVVRMQAGDLHITVKPGSYQLPKEIIEIYSS